MNVNYLVFSDKQYIGRVSLQADGSVLARSIYKPGACVFHSRGQATCWINSMHALATGCLKGIVRLAVPSTPALLATYRSLINNEWVFVHTERHFESGDDVLLELTQADKYYYVVTRIVFHNPEAAANLPAGVGLQSVL